MTVALSEHPLQSGNRAGILFMLAAMAGFILNDTCIKLASEELPVGQIIFVRGAIASALILAVVWKQGAARASLPQLRHRAVAWRTIGDVGSTGFYISALAHLPLANATAILQTVPLMTTAGAALLMRERVGARRWSAIAVGFLGVLVIVRPGMSGFNVWSLVALASVLFVVLRDLSSRALPAEAPTLGVTALSSLAVTALGAGLMPFEDWQAIDGDTFLTLSLAAGLLAASYGFIIAAMRRGEVSAVAPFRYSILLWALVLQVAIFGVWPDAPTLLGSAVLVATGVYTFNRERKRGSSPG